MSGICPEHERPNPCGLCGGLCVTAACLEALAAIEKHLGLVAWEVSDL